MDGGSAVMMVRFCLFTLGKLGSDSAETRIRNNSRVELRFNYD